MHYSYYSKKPAIETVIHVCQFIKHGSGKGVIQLLKTLKSMGFEQKLILPEPVKGFSHGNEELLEIWNLGIPVNFVDSTFVREYWTAQSLRNRLTDLVIDDKVAVVTHGGFAADVVSSLGLTFTHYCHGFGLGRAFWVDEQDRRGISKAYRVLAASQDIATQCVRLGVPDKNVFIHYYPLELSLHDVVRPVFDKEINLGQVGNFVLLKGHVYSLEVLRSILTFDTFRNRRLFLHFFGMGPLQTDIKEQVEKMGLVDNVFFHGHCSRSEIYSSIDIMMLPSLIEGLGMVNVEATEFGIPICAFDVGGVGEIVEHGKSGLLSTVKDSESMAKNIISLVKDPDLVVTLVKGAQRKIKNMFQMPLTGALLKNSLVSARFKEMS